MGVAEGTMFARRILGSFYNFGETALPQFRILWHPIFGRQKGSDIDETSLFHMRAQSLHKLFLDSAIYLPDTLGDRIEI